MYLAQQYFGVPPNLAVASTTNANIQIPGRSAVPFLTQSGIDRNVLRSIWSVADPHNYGTLTTITQFHLILRLVSMAQSGLLMSFMHQQQQQAPHDDLNMILQQYASQQLPLASFFERYDTIARPVNEYVW